jgi:hypothetical protein
MPVNGVQSSACALSSPLFLVFFGVVLAVSGWASDSRRCGKKTVEKSAPDQAGTKPGI